MFRETLRLYPAVSMMVRENTQTEDLRGRNVKPGAQIVLSPWHLHRHDRFWPNPNTFDPDRWTRNENRASARDAYMPFSTGPRFCPGTGFAMVEGPLLLALLTRDFEFEATEGRAPIPVAHLTGRAKDGIWLKLFRR